MNTLLLCGQNAEFLSAEAVACSVTTGLESDERKYVRLRSVATRNRNIVQG
jgi:hypothetical protein